jgi:hypothetical protein
MLHIKLFVLFSDEKSPVSAAFSANWGIYVKNKK